MPSTDRRRQCREGLIRVLTLPPRANLVVEFSALRTVVVLLSATTLNQPTDQRPPLKQSPAA